MSEEKEKVEKKEMIGSLYNYDYDNNTIKLRNKKCPRCGNIMAHHKKPVERWMCGNCNYTEIVEIMINQ